MTDNTWNTDGDDVAPAPSPVVRRERRKKRRTLRLRPFAGNRKLHEAPARWPAAKYKTEILGLVTATGSHAWREVFTSDFIDLAIVFSMWAVLGGAIYMLNIHVPQAYHDAMWAGIGLFSLPMGLYTGMHAYELYVLRQTSQKGLQKVVVE
ncbi:hypothetical protein H310_10757 [Aphanomyces invadans]|uniref:Uncharacterized protein n=1 Tax=Aphanomyces invadans TaxID=157072 RepID=A0A024TPP1_9STRA|nr:hypothetical protein H310_10753 [Aphanomyces invadans]XP_008875431.1 hypothetical protein H310_10757 [Aphanomyces invadans]ETV96116.1 hypothetical protein H310_10753 [Aphanomyces invadans]ETV96120.1 hypothetical protein H310_10757 [Aphanomyces invadans]|eukprot:XP_008875427.1 hypothetical protein H310_10753 [Aphanomyces invadans]